MDMSNSKPCIISFGNNGFTAGIDRLERSLLFNGYAGDWIFWKNQYPDGSPSHEEDPYAFKIYAFEEAFRRGYKVVLWVDASFWCIKNPNAMFDYIVDNGILSFKTGYSCAQTCTDALLEYMDIDRDDAERLSEFAGGFVGFNIDNPTGQRVFGLWSAAQRDGMFKNNRVHDINDSADPRFLHARQDQSALSLCIYEAGAKIDDLEYVAYYPQHTPNTYFFIQSL